MDDYISRQQIDELADLYLTDPGQDSNTADPTPIDGPQPIKLAPKLSPELTPKPDDEAASADDAAPDQAPAQDPRQADDRHPMLRLTEDELNDQATEDDLTDANAGPATATQEPPAAPASTAPEGEARDEPAPRAVLEAVLMGNLPGMSGPWLTQYAQLLAQTEGPVALLHVGEEAIDLELVEPRAEAQPAPHQPTHAVRIPPMRGNRTGLVGLLDALIQSSTPAHTVLVRFDAATDAQTLSRLAAMDDWTLLCGSDDASIAGASKQLRAAVNADPRLADRNVGIMVMGSDEDAAQHASRRIADELHHDLANPVEFIGHLKRMQPVQVRDLGSFPDPVGLWPRLVAYFDTLEVPEPLPTPAAPQPADTAKTKTPEPTPRFAPRPEAASANASRPQPAPRFRQAQPKATPTPPKPAATAPRREPATPKQQAAPSSPPKTQPQTNAQSSTQASSPMRSAPQPRVLTPQPELDLVALLAQGPAALDNPVTLDARIPDQPQTQLAVDAQGTVHILLNKVSDTVSEDVMRLMEAGQWVREHLELLALTQRDRDFVDADPVLHLLTDRADLANQHVGKLAGQVKLHLLQQVQLGKESGWFCTPLG